MDFKGYKEVPVCNDNGTVDYYQLTMIWEGVM